MTNGSRTGAASHSVTSDLPRSSSVVVKSKKILVCLILFLSWIFAAQLGLLDHLPPIPLPSPGNWLFPSTDHAFDYRFLASLIIDLSFYGLIVYALVSLVFRLFTRKESE